METDQATSKEASASERKVALVTGASGGIGEAFAEQLAADGYALVLVARSEAELGRVSGLITSRHDLPVAIVATDLGLPGAVDDIMAALDARGARPEIVVNNAGFGLQGPASDLDPERQLAMVDLNCRAVTELSLRFIGEMRARGRGASSTWPQRPRSCPDPTWRSTTPPRPMCCLSARRSPVSLPAPASP